MPITNGKYVAPTWKNNGSPALNAANMQDISDALAFSGRIATGTYVGTGTSGSSNKNSLTFPFKPQVVIVWGRDTPMAVGWDEFQYINSYNDSNNFHYGAIALSFSGNTMTWWCQLADSKADALSRAELQMNNASETYHYLAIG